MENGTPKLDSPRKMILHHGLNRKPGWLVCCNALQPRHCLIPARLFTRVTLVTGVPLEMTNVDPTRVFMPFTLVELGKFGLPLPSNIEVGPRFGHSFKTPRCHWSWSFLINFLWNLWRRVTLDGYILFWHTSIFSVLLYYRELSILRFASTQTLLPYLLQLHSQCSILTDTGCPPVTPVSLGYRWKSRMARWMSYWRRRTLVNSQGAALLVGLFR